LWIFGGFIIESARDLEFEILSKKTGIPIDKIPRAFEVYELLFPLKSGGSWFLRVLGYGSGKISLLKFFSVPFMGLGAFYRVYLYLGNFDKWDHKVDKELMSRLGMSPDEINQLIKWARLTADVLGD